MKIILGPASIELGEKVAEFLGAKTVPLIFKHYPDGESYVRLEGTVKNEDVAIVQTTSPPQDTRLLQLALLTDAAKRNGAKKVTAVVPYLAYARQDKMFLPGEAVSIQTVVQMLQAAGVDSLITVNVHQKAVLAKFPFPAKAVSAIPLLAEHFRNRSFEGAFALAPDDGAVWLLEEAKSVLGGECGYIKKHRDLHTGQISMEKTTLNVRGKTVVVFDDVISSGGTIVQAAKYVKELGAEAVYAACVHPLLIGEAEKQILDAGVKEIVGTDSVPSHVSKVSLAPLICKELTR